MLLLLSLSGGHHRIIMGAINLLLLLSGPFRKHHLHTDIYWPHRLAEHTGRFVTCYTSIQCQGRAVAGECQEEEMPQRETLTTKYSHGKLIHIVCFFFDGSVSRFNNCSCREVSNLEFQYSYSFVS